MSRDLARRIREASLLTGRFVLRSGAVSSFYRDKYRFASDPSAVIVVRGPELTREGRPINTPPWGGQVLLGGRDELAVTWTWTAGERGFVERWETGLWIATSTDSFDLRVISE